MRKLASIQEIRSVNPIPGADKIEVAEVLGWQVVVRKGEFKEGDTCCYFEIDSILPDADWSQFMRSRKFRVKTIKLRKQISQGLALPIPSIFGGNYPDGIRKAPIGDDLTEQLAVRKYDPQGDREKAMHRGCKRKQPHKWLLRFAAGRWLHQKLYPRAAGSWPEWFPKSDETRVQNLPRINEMCKGRWLYMTEKLDGQSATYFYNRTEKTGLFATGLFGVCSRNIWYKTKQFNNWWNLADKLNVSERLSNFCESEGRSIAIQGEIVGEGIQGNVYGIEGHRLYVFNVYDIEAQRYLSIGEKYQVILQLGLEGVPHGYPQVLPPRDRECADWLALADGLSQLTNPYVDIKEGKGPVQIGEPRVRREGIVIRDVDDDSFSFKAISNDWLLKGGE